MLEVCSTHKRVSALKRNSSALNVLQKTMSFIDSLGYFSNLFGNDANLNLVFLARCSKKESFSQTQECMLFLVLLLEPLLFFFVFQLILFRLYLANILTFLLLWRVKF